MYLKFNAMKSSFLFQPCKNTLIQHGEFDRRVPISTSYQLLQGLRDKGVKTELMVCKGFGHGINKSKERLVATWHKWQWFNKQICVGKSTALPIGKKKK